MTMKGYTSLNSYPQYKTPEESKRTSLFPHFITNQLHHKSDSRGYPCKQEDANYIRDPMSCAQQRQFCTHTHVYTLWGQEPGNLNDLTTHLSQKYGILAVPTKISSDHDQEVYDSAYSLLTKRIEAFSRFPAEATRVRELILFHVSKQIIVNVELSNNLFYRAQGMNARCTVGWRTRQSQVGGVGYHIIQHHQATTSSQAGQGQAD